MATTVAFEVDVLDVEYQQLEGTPWLARVYRPLGVGPFPTIVDVHGGAWNNGDRTNDAQLNQALAARGILTLAIDFRQPPQAGYPASVCDMNLAIRWLKVHASKFGGTARVGALGVSSGGHLVLLGGLRPRDPRYAAVPLPAGSPEVDASLAYVVACWPVSDPLYRYRLARENGNASIVKAHDAYWGTEAAMEEGNPPLILERGEPVDLPPTLIIQRKVDANHPLEMQERLVEWYRKRGGHIEMPLFDRIPAPFRISDDAPETAAVVDTITEFIRRYGA